MTDSVDVVVIGAGMAGLVALRELARRGLRVLAFDASARTGGRVRSVTPPGFGRAIELGPEFVHGERPRLLKLVEESGALLEPVGAAHYTRGEHGFESPREASPELDELLAEEVRRPKDRSVAELLQAAPIAPEVRARFGAFVEGFHAAELTRVSARSVAIQTSPLDESQYRLRHGYDHVRRFVEEEALAHGARIVVQTAVEEVAWQPGRVIVSAGHERVQARAVIVALPLAILNASEGPGAIRFVPELPRTRQKLQSFAMGVALRVTFPLTEPIWDVGNLGEEVFLHAPEAAVRTFWTSGGTGSPCVTAWAGGPRALALRAGGTDLLVATVKRALASLVNKAPFELEHAISGAYYHDFAGEPLIRGAYPYALVGNDLTSFEPEADTLFFAGDYTDPKELGTVGASVESALHAAERVLQLGF